MLLSPNPNKVSNNTHHFAFQHTHTELVWDWGNAPPDGPLSDPLLSLIY
jgi:hypothetical protein